MAFNHNSNLLITGGADGMIRLFGRLHVLCTLCVCVWLIDCLILWPLAMLHSFPKCLFFFCFPDNSFVCVCFYFHILYSLSVQMCFSRSVCAAGGLTLVKFSTSSSARTRLRSTASDETTTSVSGASIAPGRRLSSLRSTSTPPIPRRDD